MFLERANEQKQALNNLQASRPPALISEPKSSQKTASVLQTGNFTITDSFHSISLSKNIDLCRFKCHRWGFLQIFKRPALPLSVSRIPLRLLFRYEPWCNRVSLRSPWKGTSSNVAIALLIELLSLSQSFVLQVSHTATNSSAKQLAPPLSLHSLAGLMSSFFLFAYFCFVFLSSFIFVSAFSCCPASIYLWLSFLLFAFPPLFMKP